MPFEIQQLGTEPIILVSLKNPHTHDEVPQIHQQTAAIAENMPQRVFRIVDMSQLNWSFGELTLALEAGATKRKGSAADERFESYYVVGQNFLSKLLTKGLNQDQYGNLHVNAVATIDEAIDAIKNTSAT